MSAKPQTAWELEGGPATRASQSRAGRQSAADGPQLLFFSGGSAIDGLSRALKAHTSTSVHLVTPFDSGGSSAQLRETFGLLSLGDMRSRLVSLATEELEGPRRLALLLSHRLPASAGRSRLREELVELLAGSHPLMTALPLELSAEVRGYLSAFVERCPLNFDWQGANVGNLALAGCYFENDHDLDRVIRVFSGLLGAKGIVFPSCRQSLHLAVRLRSGEVLLGQAAFTGKYSTPIDSPIDEMYFVDDLRSPSPVSAEACPAAMRWIAEADLICYPMGSFYSSVLCHFLLAGVVSSLSANPCPKVYVPNVGCDPEQRGMTLSDTVQKMVETARKWVPSLLPPQILDYVLIDSRRADYHLELDVERLTAWGIRVVDAELARSSDRLDPELLARKIVALSQARA